MTRNDSFAFLNFDYTYIAVGDFLVFEPMIIVSNLIFFILSLIYFGRLRGTRTAYGNRMALFMLMLGISTVFGAICHSVHYQLGVPFFKLMFFCMNAFSLFAIFFCFLGTFAHGLLNKPSPVWLVWLAAVWIFVLLIYSFIEGKFLLIKINAAIVLVYALAVHLKAYRKTRGRGNLLVVYGIGSSFISIIVHTLHLSVHEWFNYKDIAHVFMIVALVLIYKGAKLISEDHRQLADRSFSADRSS